jgi:lactaldehyde reductase
VARNANPVSDALNIAAIELIGRHLVPATHGERESLFQMLVAACLAGMGFHDAGLGAVHALANTLGAHYGIHHGTANALFLPYVMEFNLPACPERFARIAVALGRNTGDLDSMSVARSALDAVRELIATTGVPTRLRDVGVPVTAVEALAQDALHQADLPGNPRECTLDDLRRLYHAAA